jgi:hypothetical protein
MTFGPVAAGISAAASLGGGILGYQASHTQAAAQEAIGIYNQQSDYKQAAWAAAQGASRGFQKYQQGAQLESKAAAGIAAGGVATTSGSALLLDTNIARQAAYQSGLSVAGGMNEAANLKSQGDAARYTGELEAYASKMQGDVSLLSGIGSAFGTATKYMS